MKHLTLLVVALGLHDGSFAAESPDQQAKLDEREAMWIQAETAEKGVAFIGATGGRAALGHFLLLRRDQTLCAVRFTSYHREGKAKPPTPFSSGEESRFAEYDWYIQADGSQDLMKSNVQFGHEKLKRSAPVGIGRLTIQLGSDHVECGTFRALWLYPIMVVFNYKGIGSHRQADEFEMAPTRWKEIAEIRPSDPALTWYNFNGNRQSKVIELDKLPK